MLLVGSSLTGCVSSKQEPVKVDDAGRNLADVREMLRQRGQRLLAGDVEGYLRPVESGARATEEPIVTGAGSVPLAEVNMVFNPERGVDIKAPSFKGVLVHMFYEYKDLPNNKFRLGLFYDMSRGPSGWVVTSSRMEPESVPFWATGPVRTERTEHFLALARPGTPHVKEALDLAEAARASLVPRLTLELDPRHLVIVARDHVELMRASTSELPEGVPALARFLQRGDQLPMARHMLVDVDYLFGARASEKAAGHMGKNAFPAELFRHELGHLALYRYQAPYLPGWVAEGGAMLLSGERRMDEWKAGLASGAFERSSFTELGERANLGGALEYGYANAAVTSLVEEFGVDRFWEFYSGFKRRGDTAEVVLRVAFRFDEAEMDRRTREWIKRSVAAEAE
jgi:hypothetical protein